MDVLISGGSLASYAYSLISVFHRYSQYRRGVHTEAKDYFETAALLITFLSLGKLLEAVAKGKTSEVHFPPPLPYAGHINSQIVKRPLQAISTPPATMPPSSHMLPLSEKSPPVPCFFFSLSFPMPIVYALQVLS